MMLPRSESRTLIVYATGRLGACLRTQTNSLRYNAAQARVSGRKLTVCVTGRLGDSGPGRKLTVCVTGGSDDSGPGRNFVVRWGIRYRHWAPLEPGVGSFFARLESESRSLPRCDRRARIGR